MAEDLKQYLDERTCPGFRSVPHYFPSGDYVSYSLSNERCHAQQKDDLPTLPDVVPDVHRR